MCIYASGVPTLVSRGRGGVGAGQVLQASVDVLALQGIIAVGTNTRYRRILCTQL